MHWHLIFGGTGATDAACSRKCPAGSRETRPCDDLADRICEECTKCDPMSYEIQPCETNSDRRCLHATHLGATGHRNDASAVPVSYEGLRMFSSPNVVAEDLHNTRNLETTYYVTDTTQASDFYWDRESGIRVNIGILNVHLIPEYDDVDSESDNNYMLSSPNNSEEKAKFQTSLRTFCRNPVPDYYSITLEISRDRTTTAQVVTCNSKDTSGTKCPPSYSNGESFLHRDLNEPCQKMGTFPELLKTAANSIVCTQRTQLLLQLFNQTYNAEKPIRFPTKKCRMAISRCEQCLNQAHCVRTDIFERRCCQVDCYALMDCKMALSEECTNAPVECAMGDAYRFTIQPVFYNMRSEVRCHIIRRPLDIIYELFVYIQTPERTFQTPKVYRTIRFTHLAFQNHGTYTADYLTVEHDTGLRLQDRLLLRRQELRHKLNYTIHTVGRPGESGGALHRKIPIHGISNNIYVASTQFENPFDFSTSSWIQENGCHKNVSRMRPVEREGEEEEVEGEGAQEVHVIIQTTGEPYRYFLKSAETAPYFKFTVPGNMSILPYYFRQGSPVLLADETLHVHLNREEESWEIIIQGEMSSCPAYVGLTVEDLLTSVELFRYDLLVLCPTLFNVTLRMSNTMDYPEASFKVRFTDLQKSYDVTLSYMTLGIPQNSFLGIEERYDVNESNNNVVIHVAATLFLGLGLCFVVAYAYLEKKKIGLEPTFQKTYSFPGNSRKVPVGDSAKFQVSGADPKQRRSILCIYVFLWSVYSISFTVTIFFYLLMAIVRSETQQLSRLAGFQLDRNNATANASAAMDQFLLDRIQSQERLMNEMQSACSNHVTQLYFRTARDVIGNLLNRSFTSKDFTRDQFSLSFLFETHFRSRLEAYRNNVRNYSHDFRLNFTSSVQQSMRNYRKYLSSIFWNGWLTFAQKVFNDTSELRTRTASGKFGPLLAGKEMDFGTFLEIEEIDQVELWSVQLWERYFFSLPSLPEMAKVSSDLGRGLHCSLLHSPSSPFLSPDTVTNKYDTSRYLVTVSNRDDTSAPQPKLTSVFIIAEEYRKPTYGGQTGSLSIAPDEGIGFDNLFDPSIVDFLQIMFLLIDSVILLYRVTYIYISCNELNSFYGSKTLRGSPLPSLGLQLTVNGGVGITPRCGTNSLEVSGGPNQKMTRRMIFGGIGPEQPISSSEETDGHGSVDLHLTQIAEYPTVHRPSFLTAQEAGKISKVNGLGPVFEKVMQNSALPRVLCCFLTLILIYLCAMSSLAVLDIATLRDLFVFTSYVDAIALRINHTNIYLEQEAHHLNDVIVSNCQRHATTELLNLQNLIDHIKTEQLRLLEAYVWEPCVHLREKRPLLHNWTCDPSFAHPFIDISLMPCNFLPILPQFYPVSDSISFERELVELILPYITAAQSVVIKTTCAVTMAAGSLLLVHIISFILFVVMETRRKEIPIRPFPSGSLSSPDASNVNPLHSEDDDNEICLDSYRMFRFHPGLPVTGFTSELKYIETKV